jgi:glycosyltransferase involved in cell wall biosynthesis
MISVVIPTRNRAKFLDLALKSIAQQSLSGYDFEVLVVDNGSIDDTAKVIAAHKSELFNLTAIYASEPGLHTGRHVGMNAAKGDILVFADDDIEALSTWLATIKECFSDASVAMVGGNNYPMFLETPPKWILKLWNRNEWTGYRAIPALSILEFWQERKEISPYWIWGCNFAIRKDVLLAAGGFHPDGMPQDLIRFRGDGETHVSRFVAESNMKCVFHPGASVYHKVPASRMTYLYFYQRGFNQGVSDSYAKLRAGKHVIVQNRSAFRYIYQKIRQVLKFGIEKCVLCKDSRFALKMLNHGYKKGYIYHQNIYKNDAEVREWVHKKRYY